MTFTLRDYQNEAKLSTFREWKNARMLVGEIPTAGGKTVVIADIIKDIIIEVISYERN